MGSRTKNGTKIRIKSRSGTEIENGNGVENECRDGVRINSVTDIGTEGATRPRLTSIDVKDEEINSMSISKMDDNKQRRRQGQQPERTRNNAVAATHQQLSFLTDARSDCRDRAITISSVRRAISPAQPQSNPQTLTILRSTWSLMHYFSLRKLPRFTTSITRLIEDQMESTEMCDDVGVGGAGSRPMPRAELLERPDFDPVHYINSVFPTEQSLVNIESVAAHCEYRMGCIDHEIRELVRGQARRRAHGQRALQGAHKLIEELSLQVSDINKKAERSESAVREITAEIKQLDCAKTNLTAAITALNHLHMLVGGVSALQHLTQNRLYKEIVLPLQAIMEVLQHLEKYRDIPQISELRTQVTRLRDQLAEQILADFKQAFTGSGKPTLSHKTLSEACAVVDVLDERVKNDLLKWFIGLQLQEYAHLFANDQEAAWLDRVERRYAWLKRHLLTFEESLGPLFPPHWQLSERIALHFCKMTRRELGAIMEARRAELDVKLLLYAIQKTYNFELLLHKRFTGEILSNDPEATPDTISAPSMTRPVDSQDNAESGATENERSPWLGLIGACFEPHLSLYIDSLDSNLRALLDRFVTEARNVSEELSPDDATAGAVLSSCADLFLFYKKCLVQCAHLTTGQPMLELAGVFQKYLREYASGVLGARVPRPAGGSGLAAAPALVSNLQSLLRDEPALPARRLTPAELARVAGVLTTAEYCLETTAHLENKLKEKVAPTLTARVDLQPERELFHKIVDECVQVLVRDLELACEPALTTMTRVNWAAVRAVGDRSAYVAQLVGELRVAVPAVRARLAGSRKYFTQVCVRFADAFASRYVRALGRCRPLSAVAAEQLLLDTHTLKTALLELPAWSDGVEGRAPPPVYTKLVARLMSRAETLLKLVMAPMENGVEAFAKQFAALLPDAGAAELRRVLDMKGVKLSRTQSASIDAVLKDVARTPPQLSVRPPTSPAPPPTQSPHPEPSSLTQDDASYAVDTS